MTTDVTCADRRDLADRGDRPSLLALAASPAARCVLIAAAILITRTPLRTRYLANWDADQFSLGLTSFDVVHHQPHPPGYLGYLVLGRALLPLAGDPNSALVALSIAGQVAAAILIYLWARRLFGEPAAVLSTLAFAVSPLAWYYAEIANTYALEPALVLAIAWAAWLCWNGERRAAVPLAAAIGLAGAIRPSTAVLMAPLAAFAVARIGDRRQFVLAAAIASALTAAWLIPLVVLAGGPQRYLMAAAALGSDVTASTAIWRAGLPGLRLTTSAVAAGVVWELGGFVVLLLFSLAAPLVTGGRAHLGLPRRWPLFATVWTLPALATFLFVHIGQLVYVQTFTPLLFLLSGPAVVASARAVGGRLTLPLAAGAALASLALLPPLAGQLAAHDRWVSALHSELATADPDSTLLVTDAYAAGSYRTAQVYLPDLHRLALSRDRHGHLGAVYGDLYEPWRLDSASAPTIPANVETLVFLDRATIEENVGDADLLTRLQLPGGDPIYVWHLQAEAQPVVRGRRLWLGGHDAYVERRGLRS